MSHKFQHGIYECNISKNINIYQYISKHGIKERISIHIILYTPTHEMK